MPSLVKVKIMCARNLPIMDKSSDNTDAFVEVKIGSFSGKTEVCRHSLAPVWNSEWFKLEIPDEELQDECLQIRIMDYDRYSADDQIGKVYLNLSSLLFKECGHQMFGFFPIFDTMNGCRGEIYCIIKLEPFNDLNKFRQTSCEVRFYHSSIAPHGYHCTQILGFVEELVVNDDPEYQWIDKIRTPRASNEARQLLFHKLSAEVQRKMGNKAILLGGNAILGYQLYYDLENSSICVRSIGTLVILKKIVKQIDAAANPAARQQTSSLQSNDTTTSQVAAPSSESMEETDVLLDNLVNNGETSAPKNPSIGSAPVKKLSPIDTKISASCTQSSLDIDLNVDSTQSQLDDLKTTSTPDSNFITGLSNGLHLLEYPFITMTKFPIGLIKQIGGVVSSRSVKNLASLNSEEEYETRDNWWMELRKEIRNHCRMLDCNAVLGYSETTTIHDEVCILSASGTAAVLNTTSNTPDDHFNQNEMNDGSPNYLSGSSNKIFNFDKSELNRNTQQTFNHRTNEQRIKLNCSLCHIPYSDKKAIFGHSLPKCAICKQARVADVIFSTIEPPINLPSIGTGCLIQARVFRNKKDTRAKEISDSLPFLEYEMHKQLLSKLKIRNMNALFNLSVQLSVGDNKLVALATGTGVFLAPLQESNSIKVKAPGKGIRMNRLNEVQKMITELVERNKERYGLKNISALVNPPIDESIGNSSSLSPKNLQSDTTKSLPKTPEDHQTSKVNQGSDDELLFPGIIKPYNKQSFEQCVVLEIDDSDDADTISLIIDSEVPSNFEICNTDQLPGNQPFLSIYTSFTQVFRAKITNAKQFTAQFDYLIQRLFVKLRRLTPCAVSGLRFKVDASNEADIIQISMIGTVVGIRNLNDSLVCKNGLDLYLPTHCYQDKRSRVSNDGDSVFDNDEETCEKIKMPSTISSVFELPNRGNPACVELTTLSYIPKCRIVKYIGNLTLPFIREITSIRECNGLNGFLTSFLNEVLLMVRTHIVALDGNALVSMNITQLVLMHNPSKNQAQCLIIITGDVVRANYEELFGLEQNQNENQDKVAS